MGARNIMCDACELSYEILSGIGSELVLSIQLKENRFDHTGVRLHPMRNSTAAPSKATDWLGMQIYITPSRFRLRYGTADRSAD
ncbi:hypothetical protein CEXT_730141 [Caerostris extrusa]|uniref:Uncharacterized protein n=1 Tax=Caerostris extrusa TaxID=172846 RepID=A0AAV4N7I1_CAEEX|nr:hypothetical protein CEXT_730141 [Caerostris extrusa]